MKAILSICRHSFWQMSPRFVLITLAFPLLYPIAACVLTMTQPTAHKLPAIKVGVLNGVKLPTSVAHNHMVVKHLPQGYPWQTALRNGSLQAVFTRTREFAYHSLYSSHTRSVLAKVLSEHRSVDLADPIEKIRHLLVSAFSLIFLLIFMAVAHAAVDLTAAQRENGSLSMLLLAPVRKADIVLGKLLALVILSAASCVVHVVCAMFALYVASIPLSLQVFSVGEVIFVAWLVLLACLLMSSVMLLCGLGASTSKQAQLWGTACCLVMMVFAVSPGLMQQQWIFLFLPFSSLSQAAQAVLLNKSPFPLPVVVIISSGMSVLLVWIAVTLSKRWLVH